MNKGFPILVGVMCLVYLSGCSLLKKKNKDAGVDLSALTDPAVVDTADTETVPTAEPTATAAAVDVGFKAGAKGQVLWKGTWYSASILAVTAPDKYKIHYTGYESSWDEVVGPSRMRGFGGAAAATTTTAAAATAGGGGGGGGGGGTRAVVAADAPCPGPGLTRRCSGRCVNLQTDDNNCGSCGTVCSGGKHCDGHLFCRDAAGNL
jgi:hypothetical protein